MITYRKVASRSMSQLIPHPNIFRLSMKGKFDIYVLWPLAQRVQNWIVDRSTACDFTVCGFDHLVLSPAVLGHLTNHNFKKPSISQRQNQMRSTLGFYDKSMSMIIFYFLWNSIFAKTCVKKISAIWGCYISTPSITSFFMIWLKTSPHILYLN